MRVRGKNATLYGAEGASSPPLPWIEVDDHEGLALIGRGLAVEVTDIVAPAAPEAPEPVEPTPVADVAPVAPLEPEVPAPVAQAAPAAPEPPEPVVEPVEPVEALIDEPIAVALSERQAAILDAIELLTPDEFVKHGPREGRPKVAILSAATDLELTADEVDAVFALKGDGQ